MKLPAIVSVLSLTLVCLAVDDSSDARKAIEARFSQVSKAFADKDVKLFESTFAEDFHSKAPGKPMMKRADVFKDFETQMKMMSNVKWTQKIKTFKLDKGVAYVTFDSELKSKVKDEESKDHDFRLVSKTKNEWIKGKTGWVVRYSESLELKMWFDGNEMKSGG